jgi:predicted nucleic acid-binding protein
MLVLDASVAGAWLLDDERDLRADRALAHLRAAGGVVPEICHLEVHNTLLVAERRGRLQAADADRSLAAWKSLPLETVPTARFDAVLGLARRRQLTFYDAIYLELAKRAGATLATLDRALLQAAAAEHVPVIET